MNLNKIEQRYGMAFPPLYHRLYTDGMLDWMGGYGDPLPEGIDWVRDVYPRLHAEPPLLFHTGGDFILFSPKQIAAYPIPEAWRSAHDTFLPFGRGDEGNLYVFFQTRGAPGEPMVAMVWEDEDTAQILAKNFEDFILRMMVDAAAEIDRETVEQEYRGQDAPEAYRADILRDLERIRPYLREDDAVRLDDLYRGAVGRTLVSYYFQGSVPAETMLAARIGFARLDEEVSIT